MEAGEAFEAAKAVVQQAEEELTASADREADLVAENERLSARLEELQEQIVRTRQDLDVTERRLGTAKREHERQGRQVREARKALQQAEDRLTEVNPPPQ